MNGGFGESGRPVPHEDLEKTEGLRGQMPGGAPDEQLPCFGVEPALSKLDCHSRPRKNPGNFPAFSNDISGEKAHRDYRAKP